MGCTYGRRKRERDEDDRRGKKRLRDMNCVRCGTANATGARFCMNCGSPIAAEPAPAAAIGAGIPTSGAFAQAQAAQRRNLMIGGAAAVLLILAALLGLSASGMLRKNGSAPQVASLKSLGANPDPGVLRKQAATAPTTMEQTSQAPVAAVMPQDVYDWLKFLQHIEQEKNDLTIKQIADLKVFEEMLSTLGPGIGAMDPSDPTGTDQSGDVPDPQTVTKNKFEDLRPAWNKLIQEFLSKPPPEECKPLADSYYKALNEIPAETGDMINLLNQITGSGNPQAGLQQAQAKKNQSYGTIDENFQTADGQLQAICDKYNMVKWFNIKADPYNGSTLGKLGFGQ